MFRSSTEVGHWLPQAFGARRKPAYFLFHVPKCAGRTIDRHLASYAAENSYLRAHKRHGLARLMHGAATLPDVKISDDIKAVAGHFLGVSLEQRVGRREIRRAILLRDPVSHLVSHYNFRMSRYIAAGLRPYGFETAYRATRRNFITHFILRNFLEISWLRLLLMSEQEKWEAISAFLKSFWFVGDYRHCNSLIAALSPELGVPAAAASQNVCDLNSAVGTWRPVRAQNLPEEVVSQIKRENRLDELLWQTWRDAEFNIDAVKPAAELSRSRLDFLKSELGRLRYQIARRLLRFRPSWTRRGGQPDAAARGPSGIETPVARSAFQRLA
jgi:hypothetical protein